ncbi:LysM peptidoglycan-binding domain-containing protein [Oceanobacillus caeni]|uniref:LysM peptidoglycan-binding domain-containing protein n=1 Tax=Oceanobacillus caeni TaxID=405946 RepID=UPI002149BB68|nr:LysM peptidoglycan-binding domain-containing protein [Oceanobacillus caeni]MCR1833969.1 LysM peptidoglycan-binding domain-containing protein [Oceanobacillus caeni]
MSADQSVFTFELNETLYFEKGQEIEELRGISLEPEITIQTNEDYISIRGVIELTGNYKKATTIEDRLEEFNHEAKRYIESVADTDDENAEFSHRFPVEISVPTYRVGNLDDVMVSVQAFDYEIPKQTQLKMFSTIAIHGINQEAGISRVEDDSVEDAYQEPLDKQEDVLGISDKVVEEEPVLSEREAKYTFEFEIKQKQQEQEEEPEIASKAETPTLEENRDEEEQTEESEIASKAEIPALEENRDEDGQAEESEITSEAEIPALEENRDEDGQAEESEIASKAEIPALEESRDEEKREEEPEIASKAEIPTLEESRDEEEQAEEPAIPSITETPTLETDRDEEEQIEEVEPEKPVEEGRWSFKTQTQTLAEFFNNHKEVSNTESSELQSENVEEEVEAESLETEGEHESRDKGDITYLSDIFRNSSEEEYTKMRLCIVQKDDTIETISERFKVSPLQIIKQNQLEDDFDVAEGQLLYIPSKK